MSTRINVGVVGGAGYTGGESIRLLIHHPMVDLRWVISRSQDGKKISETHADVLGDTDLTFVAELPQEQVDVLILCLNHGESKTFLTEHTIDPLTRIIDLGHDFRLLKDQHIGDRTFLYGLPEFQREKIKQAKSIANPGCFATAIQLGLLPLANHQILTEVSTVGITGSTGAGQKPQESTHFSWRANNISAYKTLTHQHHEEILQTLKALDPHAHPVNFIPWRGDFTRGIFVSSQLKSTVPIDELNVIYREYYQTHPFVHVVSSMVDLKQVVNTNKCLVYLEKVKEQLVIHSVLDNLLKGAAGQAIQNMNLLFGLDETMGLKLKASAF